MTFANLPLFAVLGGLAALAGVLFLLQRLRPRHVEVTVATTLFWLAAAREAPTRVFRQRFRHWLAYCLILSICALLWLALAGPEAVSRRNVDFHVLFLDGSAHTAAAGDFERAVAALQADLANLPVDRREVIWGGAFNLKLLKAGEDALLLERRLGALTPEAAPSGLQDQLRLLGMPGAWPERLELVLYGRVPVDADSLAGLRPGIRVSRGVEYPPLEAGAGIVALGVAPAETGHAERLDALVGVASVQPQVRLEDVAVTLDGEPLPSSRLTVAPAAARPGRLAFRVRDLPAAGGLLEASVASDAGSPLDDIARLRLPEQRVHAVAVAAGLPAVLADAIAADPGLRLVDVAEATVVVRPGGSDFGTDLPALDVVSAATQAAAVVIGYDDDSVDAQRALHAGVLALGLDQIDATGLATALRRPLTVAAEPSPRRRVAIWRALLGAEYNFVGARDFPVFVSRLIRWLAAERTWHPYVAAGRPLPPATAGVPLRAVADPAVDALGAEFAPNRAGPIDRGDAALLASLLSEDVATARAGAQLPIFSAPHAGAARGIGFWLTLLALALLAGEWFLHQRGLIP